jgi:exopolyphosphatase/guanosine-5'-triphosphate,3'-diphosphate pyrophosphatase
MNTPALLECGSNSLKVHYRSIKDGNFKKISFPWRLGHDVYQTGKLSEETLTQAVGTVEQLLARGIDQRNLLAIATEGLREAENREDLLRQLHGRLELEVRVISGREEASLLAEGYLKQKGTVPAFLADIGGGSLQLVHLSEEKTILRDCLPLGAIRLFYLGEEDGKAWNKPFVEDFIQNSFADASLMSTTHLFATGGTVKAIARVLGKRSFTPNEVENLLTETEKAGPPPALPEPRRQVFLPGLLVLSALLKQCGASQVHYSKITVGKIFLERLLDRLGAATWGKRKGILLQDMRITDIRPML